MLVFSVKSWDRHWYLFPGHADSLKGALKAVGDKYYRDTAVDFTFLAQDKYLDPSKIPQKPRHVMKIFRKLDLMKVEG